MGFFSMKATCAICGAECGLNRFKIGTTTSGKEIWKCPSCAKQGGNIKIDYETGKAEFIKLENPDGETISVTYVDLYNKAMESGAKYYLEGVRGRVATFYNDRVIMCVKATVGSFITGNISDGEKTIYYSDCIGVQFKKSGLQIGYLQLETAGMTMNNSQNNFFNENTFTWDTTKQSNEKMEEVAKFVQEQIQKCKTSRNATVQASLSPAEELKKFKELLDMGIITQEEFDTKKKQLLGL